jgi:hypothetical protein
MIKEEEEECNLTFNLSKLSYSKICSIVQLRAAILALSILWGKKKKLPVKEGRWRDLTPTYTTSKEWEGACTYVVTSFVEAKVELKSSNSIGAAPEISPNGFIVCNSQDQTKIIIIF